MLARLEYWLNRKRKNKASLCLDSRCLMLSPILGPRIAGSSWLLKRFRFSCLRMLLHFSQRQQLSIPIPSEISTYDHRVWKIGLPVRSAVLKPHAGWLVVGWVTTSESRLLYVFSFLFFLFLLPDAHKSSLFNPIQRDGYYHLRP